MNTQNSSYVVTEESTWYAPELIRRGFNVKKGTVHGIYSTKEQAMNAIKDAVNCPLYKPFLIYAKRMLNGVEIHAPGILDCVFSVHEHDWTDGIQHFSLKQEDLT